MDGVISKPKKHGAGLRKGSLEVTVFSGPKLTTAAGFCSPTGNYSESKYWMEMFLLSSEYICSTLIEWQSHHWVQNIRPHFTLTSMTFTLFWICWRTNAHPDISEGQQPWDNPQCNSTLKCEFKHQLWTPVWPAELRVEKSYKKFPPARHEGPLKVCNWSLWCHPEFFYTVLYVIFSLIILESCFFYFGLS